MSSASYRYRSPRRWPRSFASPSEFLAQLYGDTPGCAVLDLRMPGLNGLELQQAMASKGCHLPVIFTSGHRDVPASVRAVKAGAVDFLLKPFDSVAELVRFVDRLGLG